MINDIFDSLFGRNEREEVNKQAARRAMDILNTVIHQCSDATMVEELVGLQKQMHSGQLGGGSETIKEIYFRIICYLKGLREDVQKGFQNIARIRIDHLLDEVGKLGNYAHSAGPFSKKKQDRQNKKLDRELEAYEKAHGASILSEENIDIDSLYTNDELLQITIYREQDKLDALQKKLTPLSDQLWKKNKDFAIESDIQRIQDLIQKEEVVLKELNEVRMTNSAADFMNNIPKIKKQAIALGGISVEELQSAYQAYQGFREAQHVDQETINVIRGDVFGDPQTQRVNHQPLVQPGAVQNNDLHPKEKASAFSQEELRRLYSQARRQKAAFEKADEQYRNLIEDLQAEQRENANHLRRLLLKRRSLMESSDNVSTQECAGNDSEIEKAKAKFHAVQRAMDQLTRSRNENIANLSLIERMIQSLEIQRTQEKVSTVLGDQMLSIDSIAKYLQQFDEEENKRLAAARDAQAIADSADVETSVSDYGIDDSLAQNLANPEKYANLEKALGLR